jgi:intracellular sulfur oxidation DsrE/DsrF family protein
MRYIPLLILSLFILSVQAQLVLPAQDLSPRYLAEIKVNTATELNELLKRAEALFDQGDFSSEKDVPVAFILHGKEAKSLFYTNYKSNKALVDLAARLSAFEVVDIKVCKVWMHGEGLSEDQLPPFVGTVSLGPREEKRLIKEQGYVYF